VAFISIFPFMVIVSFIFLLFLTSSWAIKCNDQTTWTNFTNSVLWRQGYLATFTSAAIAKGRVLKERILFIEGYFFGLGFVGGGQWDLCKQSDHGLDSLWHLHTIPGNAEAMGVEYRRLWNTFALLKLPDSTSITQLWTFCGSTSSSG
jgi:hypothetical protein